MLEGIYIPSHSPSRDSRPDIPVAEKLRLIAEAELRVEPIREAGAETPYHHAYFLSPFQGSISYVSGIGFEFCDNQDEAEKRLHINTFDLGDAQLRGQGLGTRLLRRTIEYGLERYDNLGTVTMHAANLGIVKTFGKVVGEDHVAFQKESAWGSPWYGEGHDRPLEAVFEDVPYEEGDRYLFHEIRASVDPAIVAGLGESAVEATSTS